MATIYVAESGGDYAGLIPAYAAASSGDEIQIHGKWSASEVGRFNWTKSVRVIAFGESRCRGLVPSGTGAYRLWYSGSGHVINRNASSSMHIDGICITHAGTGVSDEAIRTQGSDSVNPVYIANCRIHAANAIKQQDGIYTGFDVDAAPHTIENCVFTGWGRAAVNGQNGWEANTSNGTIAINSCVAYNCQSATPTDAADAGGGFVLPRRGTSPFSGSLTLAVRNSIAVNCEVGGGFGLAVPQDIGATHARDSARPGDSSFPTVNVDSCIVSTDAITEAVTGSATDFLENIAPFDTDQGIGDYVIFNSLTAPEDLRLQNLTNGRNRAQDMHRKATALGLTIPATDLAEILRRRGTENTRGLAFDCGPYEVDAPKFALLGGEVGAWIPTISGDNDAGDLV